MRTDVGDAAIASRDAIVAEVRRVAAALIVKVLAQLEKQITLEPQVEWTEWSEDARGKGAGRPAASVIMSARVPPVKRTAAPPPKPRRAKPAPVVAPEPAPAVTKNGGRLCRICREPGHRAPECLTSAAVRERQAAEEPAPAPMPARPSAISAPARGALDRLRSARDPELDDEHPEGRPPRHPSRTSEPARLGGADRLAAIERAAAERRRGQL
jgi:hypothetical protein